MEWALGDDRFQMNNGKYIDAGIECPGREVAMGAWGPGSFQNDQSRDWLGDMRERHTFDGSDIIRTLTAGASREASDEVRVIAAAELVAAAAGRPSASLPEEAKELASKLGIPNEMLMSRAREASEQILAGSELRELWDDDPDWLREMQNLIDRLA